ncbi:plasminogen activator inhibitor 1 RNA-binding protein-like isoform X1 [Trichogramma pretiosum]|uniref:plasminogen activator inhibitor 1 RNA-binding protein-like isoform X1 n=1 Tax=Trichogramma pretiosum TaxID=7493 RepID=UPI0006C93ECA|nr:plasminogen activator inhibitor 1 RNA-binding protein-like isoform X1 [Trichogramma pretiosum]
MENAYSISVTNKFSLALDEDEDPLEILKIREQEREAKKKEKLTEKEQRAKQQEHQKQNPSSAPAKQKPRANKENQHSQAQNQQAQTQQVSRNQDGKKDGDRKSAQQKAGGERKFEAREEHNNRRNREDGDRLPRIQNDSRRGPPGEIRDNQNPREFRNFDSNDRRGGGRGRGGPGRGGRGGFRGGRGGFDNRGKREFDRQSGNDKTLPRNGYSGVKSIDKKDGAGSHNWGSHTEEIEDSFNQTENWESEKVETMETSPKTTDGTEGQSGESIADATPVEEKPVEEETRELTLDEWKALRQTRAKPTFNLRKAGEGEDLSRWKKMYALEKKKEDNEDEEEEEEYDATEYPQRVGRQKHLLDIDIQFSDSRRSAGGRGGRGGRGRGERSGGRGGFNRGPVRPDNEFRAPEQRSPRERQNAPKVDDVKDFPSLAGKAH